jgi:hypothetical protein
MPERDVCSPVTHKGSKVGSGQPLSPGATSNPSRGGERLDSVPPQSSHPRVSLSQETPVPSATPIVTGPED